MIVFAKSNEAEEWQSFLAESWSSKLRQEAQSFLTGLAKFSKKYLK
jgi:hypothetical protein